MKPGSRRRLLASLFLASLLTGIGPAHASENIEWTSGSPGGSWFTFATGLTNIITEKNPDIKIRIVPGGGRDNPSKIQAGLSQLGFGIDFLAGAALRGEAPYDKPHPKLTALAGSLAPADFIVLTTKSETRSLAELLKDPKIRIGTTPRATSEELTLRRAFEFYGTSPEKVRTAGGSVITANYSDLVSAFQDNQIDVFWGAGQHPSAFALEIQNGRRPAKLLAFPNELIANLTKFGYSKGVIKADAYTGLLPAGAVAVAAMDNILLASSDLSEDAAYRITKTLLDNRARFGSVHQALVAFDPAKAPKDLPVILHPGAARAYRELGFLK